MGGEEKIYFMAESEKNVIPGIGIDDKLERGVLLKIEALLREEEDLEKIANILIEETYKDIDILKKDSIDRFLDFVNIKVRTGHYYIPSLAYPLKRMSDEVLEQKIIKLINIHMNPEIIFRILKCFTRNIHDSDSNLYLAYLIESEDIIRAIYETFLLFKKDIFKTTSSERTINVKRVQQFPLTTDDKMSSPLDTACRLKYILEFIAMKQKVEHIYKTEDIQLSGSSSVKSEEDKSIKK